MSLPYTTALIVGAGPGIGAALARRFAALGLKVGVAARDRGRIDALAAQTGAAAFQVDAADAASVATLFEDAGKRIGPPDVVVYNASRRLRGALAELDPAEVAQTLAVSAFGAFLVAREAARLMVPNGRGAILFTGATAGIKGFSGSAPFAMGKFALRGLAQSAARELGPKGIHIAHFVIDGGVRAPHRPDPVESPDSTLDPDAIAQTYADVLAQPRSAWSFEVELRPWVERF